MPSARNPIQLLPVMPEPAMGEGINKNSGSVRFEVLRLGCGEDDRGRAALQAGLRAAQKRIPSRFFYDQRGSLLFEEICRLPEYYPTRTESGILNRAAPEIMRDWNGRTIIELGSGASRKIRPFLDAAAKKGTEELRYMPIDVCESALRRSSRELLVFYPGLTIRGMIGDFQRNLASALGDRQKMILFLGSTIGNMDDEERSVFLAGIAGAMTGDDRFFIGVDLKKEPVLLEAAYNDARGTTAAFNKNCLAVINREFRASFDESAFEHRAWYNDELDRIEMHLEATRDVSACIVALDLTVFVGKGETILTEICRKFDREQVEAMAAEAGLRLTRWFTDERQWFALAELRR